MIIFENNLKILKYLSAQKPKADSKTEGGIYLYVAVAFNRYFRFFLIVFKNDGIGLQIYSMHAIAMIYEIPVYRYRSIPG